MVLNCTIFKDRIIISQGAFVSEIGKVDILNRLNTLCSNMYYDDHGTYITIFGDVGQIIYALATKNTIIVVQ